MATDTDIANMALGHLGTRATIQDLGENSVESREISRWYATVRDVVLSKLDWNFSRVYLTLALSGTSPARWGFSYAYPSDCLKFLRIEMGVSNWFPIDPSPNYEVATDGTNRFILCNVQQAIGVYTQRVTDPNRFEPEFTAAFAMALAGMVALPITQKQDLANQLQGKAVAMIEMAMATSANEQNSNEKERVAESVSVRGYDYYVDSNWPWTLR